MLQPHTRRRARKRVGPGSGNNDTVAAADHDGVVAADAEEDVGAVATHQGVVAASDPEKIAASAYLAFIKRRSREAGCVMVATGRLEAGRGLAAWLALAVALLSAGPITVVQTLDVSGFIRSLVSNGTPYAGFELEDLGAHSGGAEFIPGSTAPSLTITSSATLVVPEPRSASMLALGLVGVLLVPVVARPLGITRQSAAERTRR